MKKSILSIIGTFFLVSFMFVACEETEGVSDPYTDWEARNQAYIDSIAEVAKNNPLDWKVIRSYKLSPTLDNSLSKVDENIYCKILEKGTGSISPIFSDMVSVHYRGRLIPLYDGSEFVFDQSFQGSLNSDVALPVQYAVSTVVTGWTTALQQMKVGDRWEVYIPSDLAYGEYGQSSIPRYSTLIFDITLVDITTDR